MKISSEERVVFAELADVLIPGNDTMPSASQANIQGMFLDNLLALRPELITDTKRAIKIAVGMPPTEAVKFLNTDRPKLFGTLSLLAAAAYFMVPEVRESLGYPGQQSRPVLPEEENQHDDMELLRDVIERGPIFRKV